MYDETDGPRATTTSVVTALMSLWDVSECICAQVLHHGKDDEENEANHDLSVQGLSEACAAEKLEADNVRNI